MVAVVAPLWLERVQILDTERQMAWLSDHVALQKTL
jgi:hypothetical protein